MYKFFTDKDSNQNVAVNSSLVKYIRETAAGTRIVFDNNVYLLVYEPFKDVVTSLSSNRSK